LFIWYSEYQLNANTNAISYSFSNPKDNVFYNYTGGYNYTGAVNSIPINSYNGGKEDADFNLVISFVNATISSRTDEPYTVINSTSAEFGFILHPNDSGSRQVCYNIDNNVASYSVKLSIQSNQGYLKTNPVYPTYVIFSYSKLYVNFFGQQSAS
jgi:hypothetical protein